MDDRGNGVARATRLADVRQPDWLMGAASSRSPGRGAPHTVARKGIEEAWIRAQRGDMVTNEGIAQWREFIEETERQPAHLSAVSCARGARSSASCVGAATKGSV